MPDHFVSRYCEGETCGYTDHYGDRCEDPAEHKVEEDVADDDPLGRRHPLTCYLCHRHFRALMGRMADEVRHLQMAAMDERK